MPSCCSANQLSDTSDLGEQTALEAWPHLGVLTGFWVHPHRGGGPDLRNVPAFRCGLFLGRLFQFLSVFFRARQDQGIAFFNHMVGQACDNGMALVANGHHIEMVFIAEIQLG